MPNPFSVDVGNPLQGLGQLGQAYAQKSQQEDRMAAQQAMQQEAQTVLESNDPMLMSQFMVANPSIAPALKQAAAFKDDSTKQNAIDTSLAILQGGDTDNILRDRAAFVSRGGGSPEGTLALIGDPEKAKKMATLTLAANMEPAQLKAMQDAGVFGAKDQKPFQQGTGQMSGYSYNPNDGSYNINPELKNQLEAKAAEKAAEGVKLGAKDRQGINKDVTTLIKDSVGIVKAAKSLSGLKKSSSPAAQLAAVFSFMKAMDPSSTVRESEQGQVYNAQGAAKGIANKINALIGKGGLSKEGFEDLVGTANNLANSAIDSSSGEINSYLETYEDTLPINFKNSLIKRVPSRLKTNEKTVDWSSL